ncbi:hypothetical protein ABH14_09075 [Brevibacillus brevis]|uniref:AAA family ATPase n=1 Tax=Brevibacillus brevis TaxID=1393 RepID=UPI001902AA2E|nr:AAA family ATPase [Brevibacillus brevis]MBH0329955.1 hypothetical protein [Brevibacillus brevis]
MLKSFSAKQYRNLNIKRLSFGKLNVVIGPNNSGKSNFIDAISFLSNVMINEKKANDSDYQTSFLNEIEKRGWNDVLDRRVKKPNTIDLNWVLSTFENLSPLEYNLKFYLPSDDHIPPDGYKITLEKLKYEKPKPGQLAPFEFISCHGTNPGKGRFSVKKRSEQENAKNAYLDVSDQDTVFNQLDTLLENEIFRIDLYPNFKRTATHVRDFFTRFRSYSSTNFNLTEIKRPIKASLQSNYLNQNGSNFLNVLMYLDKKYSFLPQYCILLKELIKELNEISIEKTDDNFHYLKLTINGEHFKLAEMSDGTIKMMLFALILWTPEKYSLLSLDEPELNTHPAWLKILANWIKRSSSSDQIFVSSHSPDLLDGFTDYFVDGSLSLFVFNSNTNNQVELVTPNMLQEQLNEGWELGDLYRIGEPLLGGWPW